MSRYIFMFNGGPVNWYSKYQFIIAFFKIKAEYVMLTLAAKKTMWLWLLLMELGLLLPNNQYTKIKVIKGNISVEKIKTNFRD